MAPDFSRDLEDRRAHGELQSFVRTSMDILMLQEHPAVHSWHHFFITTYFPMIEEIVMQEMWPDRGGIINLLDTLEAWLMNGEATAACGTYENYVLIAATVLARYSNREYLIPAKRGHAEDSYEIRHVRDNEESLVVGLAALGYEDMGEIPRHRNLHGISDRINYQTEVAAWRHPALSRSAWDLAVVAHARRATKPAETIQK